MAKGRTVSATFLTDKDRKVIKLCELVASTIIESINTEKQKKNFKKVWGKISCLKKIYIRS